MSTKPHITLIGCGKMGSALLQGWLDSNINADFSVIEPNDISVSAEHFKTIADAAGALNQSTVIILAVKPQGMAEIGNELKNHLQPDALILSIAAGQSLANFESYFGANQPVIRAMPNTPAAIGKGISVAIANNATTDEQKSLASRFLETAGKLEWIDDETLMDAVTALSGSGPAYIFYLIEMLSSAGTKAGLPADMAQRLARQTVIGAAALAENEPQTEAAALRQNVTSPGGTTEAALNILMDGTVQDVFDKTLEAATTRGKKLNS